MPTYARLGTAPLALAAVVGALLLGAPAPGQVTADLLTSLLPNSKDLRGFVDVRPADEFPPLIGVERKTEQLQDWIRTDWDVDKKSGGARAGTIAVIRRGRYSADGRLVLSVSVTVADTEANARAEYKGTWESGIPDAGSLLGPEAVGDESVAMVTPDGGVLTCRLGRTVVHVEGRQSAAASRNHMEATFPVDGIEAVAHSILARAVSILPDAAGSGGAGLLAVDVGRDAQIKGLASGKRTYVPVVAMARSAGWQAAWDARAGTLALTRSGKGTVHLQVFRASAKVGATGKAKLLVPPFLLRGEPTMDLAELVGLLGGTVEAKTKDHVSVRI